MVRAYSLTGRKRGIGQRKPSLYKRAATRLHPRRRAKGREQAAEPLIQSGGFCATRYSLPTPWVRVQTRDVSFTTNPGKSKGRLKDGYERKVRVTELTFMRG
jgi:hypothetical protein